MIDGSRHPFRALFLRHLPHRPCAAWLGHAAAVGLLLTLPACGKKGPPLAPQRVSPARIEDLAVQRTGDEVRARFTVPSENDDKSKPADIESVELYAITGKPEGPTGAALSGPDFIQLAEELGRVEVKPPPSEEATPAAPPPARNDPRPAQGDIGSISEKLGPAALQPFVHPRRREATPTPVLEEATAVKPLAAAPAEEPFARVYIAVGVSHKGHKSAVSNRVALPVGDIAVSPPATVAIDFSEVWLTVTWTRPPDVALPPQRAAAPDEIPARSLVAARIATTYNVYAVTRQDGGVAESKTPVNPAPVGGEAVTLPVGGFGVERCFVVRSGLDYGRARVQGPPSAVTCVTPVDKFAPAAPKNLIAVGSEGGVSLIWDSNAEADLGGYLVLRGELGPAGAAAVLKPLTPEPIKETTYRDATARPGVRYVYAVVAVDTASPRNTSPESNHVEEGAR